MSSAPDCEQDCASAVMFARFAALSPPAVPPGLNERIVCEVPRLAQMPAPYAPLRARALRLAAAPVAVAASPVVRRAAAGWRPVGGWAALAAGFAALVLMVPSAFKAHPPAPTARASPPRQFARNQADAARPGVQPFFAAPVSAVKLAANHPVRAQVAPSPVIPDSDAASPTVAIQPAPEQVAFAAPAPVASSRPVYGPVDTEPRSTAGVQGIGQGATAGFAFTNYDSGTHQH